MNKAACFLSAVLLIIVAHVQVALATPGESNSFETFGKWTVVCAEPTVCILFQGQRDAQDPSVWVRTAFEFKNGELLLHLRTSPMTIDSTSISVDGRQVGIVHFDSCSGASPCVSKIHLRPNELQAILNGHSLSFTVWNKPQEGLSFMLSLDQLGPGLDRLKERLKSQ